MHPRHLQEVERARKVVRNTEAGRGQCEAGIAGCDHNVASHHEFTGASPDRTLDHGNDGSGMRFEGADGVPQRIVVSEWIAAIGGKLADIVSGGKYFSASGSSQDHHLEPIAPHLFQSLAEVFDQLPAERVDLPMLK